MAMFVRIHPKDPRTGHLVERYVYRGMKFEVKKGWYRVSDQLASELKDMVTDVNAPVPVPVFQVAAKEEAEAIERADYERENPERKISDALSGAQTVSDKKLDDLPEDEELVEEYEGDDERDEKSEEDEIFS